MGRGTVCVFVGVAANVANDCARKLETFAVTLPSPDPRNAARIIGDCQKHDLQAIFVGTRIREEFGSVEEQIEMIREGSDVPLIFVTDDIRMGRNLFKKRLCDLVVSEGDVPFIAETMHELHSDALPRLKMPWGDAIRKIAEFVRLHSHYSHLEVYQAIAGNTRDDLVSRHFGLVNS